MDNGFLSSFLILSTPGARHVVHISSSRLPKQLRLGFLLEHKSNNNSQHSMNQNYTSNKGIVNSVGFYSIQTNVILSRND